VLYSRASADPEGRPWSERKRYIWWDERAERWTGYDVPDFPVDKRPDYVAPDDAKGMDAISGSDPFIMQADGRAWLFAPAGLLDGPLPTHYEPLESPSTNALYPDIAENPAALRWTRADNPVARPGDPRWPCVATTFRLTEHHTAGGMSRWVPWLAELQPEMFAEVSPELARERGLEHGGWMTVVTTRAAIEARVLVTERIAPLTVEGRRVHQVGLPYHWGRKGYATGDSANDLLGLALDPNVQIGEYKASTCDVRPGRRPRGPARRELVDAYVKRVEDSK
jgi:formate dehydrogenase major subunit